jgi:peptidoglycan lytic transglycosylase
VKTRIALMAGLIAALSTAGPARAHQPQLFIGIASVYSDDYSGETAAGEPYDPAQFTAAHATLPFGTLLRVSDPCNVHSVTVVVNDRGPFVPGRVLDLSRAAGMALGIADGTLLVTAVVEHIRPIHLRALLSPKFWNSEQSSQRH